MSPDQGIAFTRSSGSHLAHAHEPREGGLHVAANEGLSVFKELAIAAHEFGNGFISEMTFESAAFTSVMPPVA